MTDTEELVADFEALVNIPAEELEEWLATRESRSVGAEGPDGESVGHASGRRIVELLRKDPGDYDAADLEHMRKVRSYIKRHLAQRPDGDVSRTRWRYSLLNWGHDPLR